MTVLELKNNIVSQLCDIYFNLEHWHDYKVSPDEAYKYHGQMYENGNIIVCLDKDKVLGYVEIWKINFEQFGRLVCHAPFIALNEDITTGNIAYVANTFILPEYRKGYVYKVLKLRFFSNTHECQYYVGHAIRKTASQPIKVFDKSKLSSNLFLKGEV